MEERDRKSQHLEESNLKTVQDNPKFTRNSTIPVLSRGLKVKDHGKPWFLIRPLEELLH